MDITIENLIIPHEELTSLLTLKAQYDDKPTAEQLQQQLDEANARIAELEAMQKKQKEQISEKSKAPISATFKAIKDICPELTIDNVLNQTQINGTPVSRAAIANYLAGKI